MDCSFFLASKSRGDHGAIERFRPSAISCYWKFYKFFSTTTARCSGESFAESRIDLFPNFSAVIMDARTGKRRRDIMVTERCSKKKETPQGRQFPRVLFDYSRAVRYGRSARLLSFKSYCH